MKKHFLSSFGKKVIAASLIGGSIFVGGFFAGYYLFFNSNKTQDTNQSNKYVYKSQDIFGKNSPKFIQAKPEGSNDYWLSPQEEQELIQKIKNELGYGPEFDKLRSITIGDENMTGDDANGVYYSASDQIYINLEHFKEIINKLKNKVITDRHPMVQAIYTNDILSKIKINLIFETIFHEYGHHIGFTYLTNEFNNNLRAENIYIGSGTRRRQSNWNEYFVKQFKKYLNYSDWQGQKYTSATQTFQNKQYKSIGSLYSQADLFKYANQEQEYKFNDMDKFKSQNIEYRFGPIGDFTTLLPYKINKDQLSYYYSMDELFTRKYQQLNQIYNPVNNYKTFLQGFFAYSDGQNKSLGGISDILFNTLLYQNEFGNVVWNGNKYELKNFKDYVPGDRIYDNPKKMNPNFDDPAQSNRFLYDSPFNNNKYKYKDESGNVLPPGEDNHIKLYDLMDDFLGHKNGADVSIVWPKNSINNNGLQKTFINSQNAYDAENLFKFGGYVDNDQYDSVGYKDSNGTYVELSKIGIKNFTYKYKDWLGATTRVDLDQNLENYFYTTNNFINKNKLLGKVLCFKKLDGSYETLKTAREGAETGTNSTWYSQLASAIFKNPYQIHKYSFVADNGSVKFMRIQ